MNRNGAVEIDGVNVWLLNHLARLGNFTVEFDILRLDVDTSDRALVAIRALDIGGYDCVVSSLIHSYERALYMHFLQPHVPYGFVVVSNAVKQSADPLYTRLWQWVKPFTWAVWCAPLATPVNTR